MDFQPNFHLIRLLVDFVILYVVYRFAHKHYIYLKKTSDNTKIMPSASQGFYILSKKPCEIIAIQFSFVLGNYNPKDNLFNEILVYLTVKIQYLFEEIQINLPFESTSDVEYETDGAKIFLKKGSATLVINDGKPERKLFTSGNIIFYAKGSGIYGIDRQELIFKADDPWASGRPLKYGRPYPAIIDGKYLEAEYYSPKIQVMEVIFSCLNNYSFAPDLKNSFPKPDYFASREMRWHTGDNLRNHTSIRASFESPAVLDRINKEKFQANIWFALFSAACISILLDGLWTFIGLLKTIT